MDKKKINKKNTGFQNPVTYFGVKRVVRVPLVYLNLTRPKYIDLYKT